jgi:hypothetical protein
MTSNHDPVSRSDFALIIRAAAKAQSQRSGEDVFSLQEAERIAAEVGIDPAEFRAAARTIRAQRLGAKRFLGPSGVMVGEETLPRAVVGEEAYQLLAQGQLSMTLPGAAIHQVGTNYWRLGERSRGELQVATRGDQTRIAAFADNRKAKAALLAGPILGGGIAGSFLLSGIAFSTVGTPEALAMSNVIGMVGGSLLGFVGGRAAWIAFAKRSQEKIHSAIERMRALAGTTESSEKVP